jgi:hypothetical protein
VVYLLDAAPSTEIPPELLPYVGTAIGVYTAFLIISKATKRIRKSFSTTPPPGEGVTNAPVAPQGSLTTSASREIDINDPAFQLRLVELEKNKLEEELREVRAEKERYRGEKVLLQHQHSALSEELVLEKRAHAAVRAQLAKKDRDLKGK